MSETQVLINFLHSERSKSPKRTDRSVKEILKLKGEVINLQRRIESILDKCICESSDPENLELPEMYYDLSCQKDQHLTEIGQIISDMIGNRNLM